jgi:uncharacterized iron-regulated membrane protein
MLIRSLLVAFAGQAMIGAALLAVILWRERVKRRRDAEQKDEAPPE